MHAKEQTVVQLLEGQKQYLVPLFQRTFSWQRQEVEQLWRDALVQAMNCNPKETAPVISSGRSCWPRRRRSWVVRSVGL